MSEPLTFVLDTNILLRLALKKTKVALNVWEALLADTFTLALSESILSEVARVLGYPRIARKNNLTDAARTEFIAALRENAVMIEELYEVWRVDEDETDNMFLACAMESYADYLVSEDKHLRAIKYYQGVQIIGLDHFLQTHWLMITPQQIESIIDAVVAELQRQGVGNERRFVPSAADELNLDLPDITTPAYRARSYVENARKPDVLRALMQTTTARIGIGHAGPRYRNIPQFIFWADHAVTQDALFKEIDPALLQQFNLFEVQSQASSRQEYLLRPDLGRKLSDAARKTLQERCVKNPDVQVYVSDGLSAAAIEHNLRDMLPVIQQGLQQAGLKMGTPFYVKYGRVGLLNDVNAIVDAKVVVTLIGERPGLGRAEAMSAYMGFRPQPDSSDADRDVVCNIFNGGTNPLEAGAYVVEYIKRMLKHGASGIKLKLIEQGGINDATVILNGVKNLDLPMQRFFTPFRMTFHKE